MNELPTNQLNETPMTATKVRMRYDEFLKRTNKEHSERCKKLHDEMMGLVLNLVKKYNESK